MSSVNSKKAVQGVIDGLVSGTLAGWVYSSEEMGAQEFHIQIGDLITDAYIANTYREDLEQHGFSNGCHSFYVDLNMPYEQLYGKTIQLLDSSKVPIDGACFDLNKNLPLISFSLLSRNQRSFEFIVTCSSAIENLRLFLCYGAVRVPFYSVTLDEGESHLKLSIPVEIIDGAHDRFSLELEGFPAPVWLAYQSALTSVCDSVMESDFVSNELLIKERHKTLDLHIQSTQHTEQLSHYLSAYRCLSNKKNGQYPLVYQSGKDVDATIILVLDDSWTTELLIHTLASILFAYNKATFGLVIVVKEAQKHLLDVLSNHDIQYSVIVTAPHEKFVGSFKRISKQVQGQFSVIIETPVEAYSYWLDELISSEALIRDMDVVTPKLLSVHNDVYVTANFTDLDQQEHSFFHRLDASHPSVNYVVQDICLKPLVWCVLSSFWRKMSKSSINPNLSFKELFYPENNTGSHISYQPHSQLVSLYNLDNSHSFELIGAKKKRVLVIDHALPEPSQDAGSYAIIQEICLIQSLGFDVTFVDMRVSHYQESAKALESIGVEVLCRPFFSSLESVIKQYAPKICAAYLMRYYVAEKVLPYLKRIDSRIPILFNNADLHFLRELREASSKEGDERLNHAAATKERELAVMSQVDAVLSYTDVEQAVIASHLFEKDKLHLTPWVLEEKSASQPFRKRHGVAFLGGYAHKPNVEAVTFFLEKVAPLLAIKAPEIVFYVYGSNMPNSLLSWGSDNVRLIGFVENLDDVYTQHRIFIAPLLSGAGIKGKVLESLAYGLPTVLSAVAAEGIGLTHNISTLLAESPEEWCDEIIRLYQDKKLWVRISENQKIIVRDRFSPLAAKKKMKAIFTSVGLI